MTELPHCETLLLAEERGVLTVTLNRPHKRNAMDAQMVGDLIALFAAIVDQRRVRAVVLRGAQGHFCAGGDIAGMARSADDGSALEPERAAWEFNRSFGRMITTVEQAPQVVIALLEGAVLGGGLGLACGADVAIADAGARLALPETGLGLVPAQIAPFVVARVGLSRARWLTLLGEQLDGRSAVELGLAHYLVDGPQAMAECLDGVLRSVRRCAPGANATSKALLLQATRMEREALLDHGADCFTASLLGAEGREGTRAFAEKRRPDWAD